MLRRAPLRGESELSDKSVFDTIMNTDSADYAEAGAVKRRIRIIR